MANDLDQTRALDSGPFQHFWYRHKRVFVLQNVKKLLSNASYPSRQQAEKDFDSDEVLSITDQWDMESNKLRELKDEVQQCLRDDRYLFNPDQVNTVEIWQ